jgi:hypothetical protein
MVEYLSIIRLIHILTAVFMAAPLYMIISANERGRLGPPLSYRVERYFENIVKRQPLRCYVYLFTIFISGAGLLYLGPGLGMLITDWKIALKTVFFLMLLGLITYVHTRIQPPIESLLKEMDPDGAAPPEDVSKKMMALRIRRKKLGSVCMFLVVSSVVLGVSSAALMGVGLTVFLMALGALFSWRVYSSLLRFGWI